MFVTRLNLMPPQKKVLLRRTVTFQTIKSLLELLLVVICVAGTLLLASETVLQSYFSDLTVNLISVNSHHITDNRLITQINKRLTELEAVQNKRTEWRPTVDMMIGAVPEGIVLSGINLNKTYGAYTFTGQAATRAALLAFQSNLESLTCVEGCSFSAPVAPSLLTQKERISFSITAQKNK